MYSSHPQPCCTEYHLSAKESLEVTVPPCRPAPSSSSMHSSHRLELRRVAYDVYSLLTLNMP